MLPFHRPVLAVLLSVLPLQACAAQRPAAGTAPSTAGPQTPSDAPRESRVAGVVSVPLTKIDGFYYVDVAINGRPYRFTLETGAAFNGISQRAAQALGLQVDSMELMPGSRAAIARIDSLRLGGALLRGITARVTPRWDAGTFDGIISLATLRDVLATIDLAGGTLRLETGALPAPNGRDIVAVVGRDRAGRIDLPITLGSVEIPAVLDTRSSFWIIVPDSLESQLAMASAPTFVTNAMGPSLGSFRLRGARLAASGRFGTTMLERPAVMLRDRPGTVLGVPFMEQFVFTLDQRQGRVRIARASAAPVSMPAESWENGATAGSGTNDTPRPAGTSGAPAQGGQGQPTRVAAGGEPPSGTWTMGFGMTGGPGSTALSVARVFAGSSAEKAGLVVGDQVVEFNGTPAAQMNPVVSRAAATGGKPVKVVVLRDGKRVELMVSPYQIP